MKNLLRTSIVLLIFSFAALLFNLSCRKEVSAQTNTSSQSLGLIFFQKAGDPPNVIWKANYDGTGQTRITIAGIPANSIPVFKCTAVSPDGRKIFFLWETPAGRNIFSCNIDGTGITGVVENCDDLITAL
jgi:hypothetical protein